VEPGGTPERYADQQEESDVGRRVDELMEWADTEEWPDAAGWVEPDAPPVLWEDYAGADDEAYDDALEVVLDGMSAAEGFNLQKALNQLGSGASSALANPVVGQLASTALPVGATMIGGQRGGQLGKLAAGALVGSRAAGVPAAVPARPAASPLRPVAMPGVSTPPAVAGGSNAAHQARVLSGLPVVQNALAALAMGQHGARQVDGVPVASVMNLLSSVFGQAAADADEIAYLDGVANESDPFGDEIEPDLGSDRSLYMALIGAENEESGW
jgi:hypothetical protein